MVINYYNQFDLWGGKGPKKKIEENFFGGWNYIILNMSYYCMDIDSLNDAGYWSDRQVSKAFEKMRKYCWDVIFDLQDKNKILRSQNETLKKSLTTEKRNKKECDWDWNLISKNLKKGDFSYLKYLPKCENIDWNSLAKKSVQDKPEPKVQDTPEPKVQDTPEPKAIRIPKFETGIAVWYVNPNRRVPQIAQVQKIYTDDPTGFYYDVKFQGTEDITQTVESYLYAIDGSPVSEAFGKLTEKLEKYEVKQKALKTLVTSS